MAISENAQRFVSQVWQGTVGQIRRASELAAIWEARVGQPEWPNNAAAVTNGASSFIDNIDRLNAASQDATKGPLVDKAIAFLTDGVYTTNQVRNVMGNLRSACVTLRDADKSTDATLTSALQTFAANVPTLPDDPGLLTIWD